tara:strand:- start:34 stop:231 length:198 start_codon:yes stop_codon:yes gene_type:complete
MSNLAETKTEKSNLTLAFEQVKKLNLGLTLEQYIDLNDVLYILATEQFRKGMKEANEIHNKYNNL